MSDIGRGIASAAGPFLSRRGLIAGAGTALVAGAALARPARAQAKSRLVFALSSYPPSIRPWQNTGTAAATVKLTLHRGLLSYDARGEIRGELAESWRREMNGPAADAMPRSIPLMAPLLLLAPHSNRTPRARPSRK